MAQMVKRKCSHCNKDITVRMSDIKRGWGKFCDRSCSALFRAKMDKYKKFWAGKWIRTIKKITGIKNVGRRN